MTDNEIIKVLEEALRVADETINRQKAEIARLESAYTKEYVRVEHLTERLTNARAEAFKEFASELKQMSCGYSFESDESNQTYQMIDTEDIDDLLERKLKTDVTTTKETV